MDKHNDIEFDLIELLLYIKKKILVIIAVVLLFAVGGFLFTKMFITPEYTAHARIHVFQENDESVDLYSMQISTLLRRDCEILATGKNVSKQVIDELGLKISPESLSSRLSVVSEDTTRIMELYYVDTDPLRAADVLNKVCDITKAELKELMKGDDVVQIVYYADPPVAPSSPSPLRNAAVSAIVGLAVIIVVLVVFYLMDDTIRTEEDVEKYMGLSTLSSVPISDELATLKRVGDDRIPNKKQRRDKGDMAWKRSM